MTYLCFLHYFISSIILHYFIKLLSLTEAFVCSLPVPAFSQTRQLSAEIIRYYNTMASPDLEFIETFTPSSAQIDFLTEKINEESRALNISCDAYPFGIFVKEKKIIDSSSSEERKDFLANNSVAGQTTSSPLSSLTPTPDSPSASTSQRKETLENKDDEETIIGGCNGSIIYGSIYTDQLWVDQKYRGKGIGKMLMEKVHDLAKRRQCTFATVGTMDFQGAQSFYERLGYQVEFERGGYANEGKMTYLKKVLIEKL